MDERNRPPVPRALGMPNTCKVIIQCKYARPRGLVRLSLPSRTPAFPNTEKLQRSFNKGSSKGFATRLRWVKPSHGGGRVCVRQGSSVATHQRCNLAYLVSAHTPRCLQLYGRHVLLITSVARARSEARDSETLSAQTELTSQHGNTRTESAREGEPWPMTSGRRLPGGKTREAQCRQRRNVALNSPPRSTSHPMRKAGASKRDSDVSGS